MIKIKAVTSEGKQVDYKLPTTWSDFSWKQLTELNRKYNNRAEKLAAYAGVDLTVLLNNIPFLFQVNEVCGFIFDGMGEEFADYLPAEARKKLKEIAVKRTGDKSAEYFIELDEWMKFEKVRAFLSKEPESPFKGTIEMIREYLGMEVADRPCTEVFGIVAYFFLQINDFATKYKALGDTKPDPDEVAAGVSRFEKYGVYNTVAMFTGGDPRPEVIEQFEKAPLGVVYLELYRRKEAREFEKDLATIKKINADGKK